VSLEARARHSRTAPLSGGSRSASFRPDELRFVIANTTNLPHTIRTERRIINGCRNLLKLGDSATVELFSHSGKWIVTAACSLSAPPGVEFGE
jgi:hypothetical protein